MSRASTTVFAIAFAIVLVGAGATYGFGVPGGASTAEASASGTSYASVTNLEGASGSGQVEDITVGSSGNVKWENMPSDISHINVSLWTNSGPDKSYQAFAHATFDGEEIPSEDVPNGQFSWSVVEGSVIQNTDFTAESFSADGDGETQRRWFPVVVKVTVVGEDGTTCEFRQTHKVKTEVSNLADPPGLDGDTGIDGDIDMEGDEKDDEDCRVCQND